MNIVSRFRCGAAVHGAYVTLDPIGPPDGATGVVVGTGRGPCELGKVNDPSEFVIGAEYEIIIQRVGVPKNAGGETATPGNDTAATDERRTGRNGSTADAVANGRDGMGVN